MQLIYLVIAARYYGVRITALHAVGGHLIITATGHRADLADFMTVAQRDDHLRSLALACLTDLLR